MALTYDFIKDFIGNVGFPIAVTFYVLFRLEQKIDKLISTIERGLARLN